MPGQHDDHGSQVDPFGAAGEVGEELQRVVDHGVGRVVVLYRPDRVEAEWFGQPAEVQLLLQNLPVRDLLGARILATGLGCQVALPVRVVLRDERHADFHVLQTPSGS